MVEAAVGWLLLFSVLAVSIFFLVNVGVITYYQDKVGMVTNRAAAYAASLCSWYGSKQNVGDDALTAVTQLEVAECLQQMNIISDPNSVKVQVVQKEDNKVQVTVKVNDIILRTFTETALLGAIVVRNFKFSLQDTSVATLNNDIPPMTLTVNGFTVPAYGKYFPKRGPQFLAKHPGYRSSYDAPPSGANDPPGAIAYLKNLDTIHGGFSLPASSYSENFGTAQPATSPAGP